MSGGNGAGAEALPGKPDSTPSAHFHQLNDIALYMDKGRLTCGYDMMIIERSAAPIPAGKHCSELTDGLQTARPMAATEVLVRVDRLGVARPTVARSLAAASSASETFGVGVDVGSTVSLHFIERRPFRFDGKASVVKVALNN